MAQKVYLLGEILSKVGIDGILLSEWETAKLISPSGISDEQEPYYSDISFNRCLHIKNLTELGYSLDDIKKIIKKVGLPATRDAKTNNKSEKYLTVGALGEKIGVSPRTIKHWEEKGIIDSEMKTGGGFRLYTVDFVLIGNLIKDLQLFGYSLDEIKSVADSYKELLTLQNNIEAISKKEADAKIETLFKSMDGLYDKMKLLKEGISRWEELLKKKKKEINELKNKNAKRN
jgi:MerR family transcriptional regulator, repressor of the yfmOP operon